MRRLIVPVCWLAVACGGTTPPSDGGSDAQPAPPIDAAVGLGVSDASAPRPAGDLGNLVAPACSACAANQICDGTSCVDLPAHCPCPLGSYCDLAGNRCVKGCLGNDHCPANERCDTSVFQCVLACKQGDDCPGHLTCSKQLADGSLVCPTCIEAHGDMGGRCYCTSGYADCNGNPADGCETPLGTLTNCDACGQPASASCVDDKDGDGYGVSSTSQIACRCPAHTIWLPDSKGEDCDDQNGFVHPGQTNFFTQPRASGSFDYDCNGVIETQYDYSVGKCNSACDSEVWSGSTPACGAMGTTLSCYVDSYGDCAKSGGSMLTQGCR